jgi:DDE superfamily endonuclease
VVDVTTFLTELYVMVDDFCHSHLPPDRGPGPAGALTRSEVVTLALFAQWGWFTSERDFYRYADRHLRGAFPTLPNRTQFNRAGRRHQDAIVAFGHCLAQQLTGPEDLYEALDSAAVPTRNPQRRGRGWLAGQAALGWSNRRGWFEGLRVLLAVTPRGVITGFGSAPGSREDRRLADTFFAGRWQPDPRLPSVGAASGRPYLADKGFAGRQRQAHWAAAYGATVIAAPQRHRPGQPHPWPKAWRRWLAGLRQIVETVIAKLQACFRLEGERPHDLAGLLTRLAAKMALHNFCLWLNRRLGRPWLAMVDLVDW